MDLPYQRKIKGLYSRLSDITEIDIQELDELGFTQNCDIENTIKQNPEIGERQLIGTLNALLEEHRHLDKMVDAKIKNLVAGGLDFTDHQCLNTREVLLNMEGTIGYLLRLSEVYFPERAAKNIEIIRKFDRSLANRIMATKKEGPGPKGKTFTSWDQVAKKGRIDLIKRAIQRYRSQYQVGPYTPVSIVEVLKDKKYITIEYGEFSGVVRFIAKECDINFPTEDENMVKPSKAQKGIKEKFNKTLTQEIASPSI
ncbi:MAG: hypothetical protein R6U58_08340 [Bacteroidales bacterium]